MTDEEKYEKYWNKIIEGNTSKTEDKSLSYYWFNEDRYNLASQKADPNKIHRLFVFGTLQSGHGNNRLMRNSKLIIRPAILKGYFRSDFISVYKSNNPDDIVTGEVWKVPEPDLFGPIDSLECHPYWYKRTWIDDQLGGCWIYLMQSDHIWESCI